MNYLFIYYFMRFYFILPTRIIYIQVSGERFKTTNYKYYKSILNILYKKLFKRVDIIDLLDIKITRYYIIRLYWKLK